MPSVTFALPHWIYWLGLIFVPLIAMYIVRKQRGQKVDGGLSNPIAYMLWLAGGFVGLHRFYVKNAWGLIYIPIFIALLLANVQVKDAMDQVSAAKNNLSIAEFELERAQAAAKEDQADARQKLAEREQALETAKQDLVEENAGFSKWNWITRIVAMVIALMLIVDAFLLPKLVRQCAASECREVAPAGEAHAIVEAPETGKYTDPALNIHLPSLAFIDRINGFTGKFVCYWSIIAVFVYYYEVLARYVFNSPTNWAHEGMFLMFGMQYMLAAGFALREDSHVRVDVIYLHLPDRVKALIDMITSIFFFIFAIALFWTGWTFAADSIRVWEVSFTEWAIQYWPVKLTLVIGPLLLFLQGFARLIKEVVIITGKKV
jgi:TRAP-type mannitol/chloroaromatic compound transport system permease small subunit